VRRSSKDPVDSELLQHHSRKLTGLIAFLHTSATFLIHPPALPQHSVGARYVPPPFTLLISFLNGALRMLAPCGVRPTHTLCTQCACPPAACLTRRYVHRPLDHTRAMCYVRTWAQGGRKVCMPPPPSVCTRPSCAFPTARAHVSMHDSHRMSALCAYSVSAVHIPLDLVMHTAS
jgi:hypothetical protein